MVAVSLLSNFNLSLERSLSAEEQEVFPKGVAAFGKASFEVLASAHQSLGALLSPKPEDDSEEVNLSDFVKDIF